MFKIFLIKVKTLNEEVSQRKVPEKKKMESENNHITSETIIDCNFEDCSESEKTMSDEKDIIPDFLSESSEDDDGKKSQKLLNSNHMLKNEMDSLMDLIKSKYEEQAKLLNLKEKIDEHHKKTRKEFSGDMNFLSDQSFLLNSMDVCMKDSSNVKKLN